MDDERIERALRLGPVDEPAYQPRGAWKTGDETDVRADSSGPARPASARREAPHGLQHLAPLGVRIRDARRPSRRSFPMTIAASAVVLIGLLLAVQLAPAGPAATPQPSPDLLARLTAAGSVEVAVRNTPPQTVSQGGAYIGFDVDVAKVIAQQLGLRANVSPVSPDTFSSGSWELALPGHDAQSLGGPASQPYAYWPAWLAAGEGSPVTDLASLSSARVCVVDGSAGADWLAGNAGGATVAAPPGATPVVMGSDDECVAALNDGQADALVTANLLSDEVQARGLHLVIPTPVVSDPWIVVVRGPTADTASLLAAVDHALAALQRSGQLADLSRSSFGGLDVTVPTP